MKRLKYNALMLFVGSALVLGLSQNAFAQRPSRGGGSSGGGRGGAQMSAPRVSSGSRQPAMQAPSRPSRPSGSAPSGGISPSRPSRPNYNYGRPGYRPGYGSYHPNYGYNRRYYGFYNYYRPFIGFRLNVLPFGYYPFYYGSMQFYYSDGLFYRQYDNSYEVVIPPVGAEVPNLPNDASLVTINGVDYYEYKGVYYTQSTNADGKSVYIVAGKDGVLNTADGPIDTHQIGDVVNQLPEGSREVTIKNEKYYISPDEVYYEAVLDANNSITGYRLIGRIN